MARRLARCAPESPGRSAQASTDPLPAPSPKCPVPRVCPLACCGRLLGRTWAASSILTGPPPSCGLASRGCAASVRGWTRYR
eukprot:6135663-Pyramimonas_sp.AAC.1